MVTAGRNYANAHRTMAPANNASTSNPNDGPPHEVQTISGGYVVGDSAKARKDNARNVREIMLGHQINMAEHVAKLSKRENTVISFTDDEARHLIHPHIDALMVTLSLTNGKVFRILIDTGSSTDILFTSAFHQMNIGGPKMRPIKTPLYGFGGERVYADGAIQLPVTFGVHPAKVTQMVDFLLVDQPSAYNAIIGRPTLNKLRAVVSTYHLGMKFPTGDQVGEVI